MSRDAAGTCRPDLAKVGPGGPTATPRHATPFATFGLATLLLAACAPASPDVDSLDRTELLEEVRAVEMSFAAAARQMPTRDAFLQFLAEGSILFRPGPVDGRSFTEGLGVGAGSLEWSPFHVDVSEAGDLGYTFGPWTARDAGGTAVGWGEYVTLWQRQTDGTLRAVLDHGITYGREITSAAEPVTPLTLAPVRNPATVGASLDALLARDAGPVEGQGTFVRTRYFRNGGASVEAEVTPAAPPESIERRPVGGAVSLSDDLAYSYGTALGREDGAEHAYLRIWRCCVGDDWVVVIDVLTPY